MCTFDDGPSLVVIFSHQLSYFRGPHFGHVLLNAKGAASKAHAMGRCEQFVRADLSHVDLVEHNSASLKREKDNRNLVLPGDAHEIV